jgi:small subunit ribosomal protein S9
MNQAITNPVQATGRRKNATARLTVYPGSGRILVKNKTLDDYFGGLGRQKKEAIKPIELFAGSKDYDFDIDVMGGGVTGQSGAIRHALARAIIKIDPTMRAQFKKEGLLTRDSRMVERKKPGRAKARKRFQFSKR